MSKVDLSLVPGKELLAEIERRYSGFICAYVEQIDGELVVRTLISKRESWVVMAGIASVLWNDITNPLKKDEI